MTGINVSASNPRPTSTGVARGVDLDVVVEFPDGLEARGEVTLLPAEDGRPEYDSWGRPDHWVCGPLLEALENASGGDQRVLRDMLGEISAAAAAVAGAPS